MTPIHALIFQKHVKMCVYIRHIKKPMIFYGWTYIFAQKNGYFCSRKKRRIVLLKNMGNFFEQKCSYSFAQNVSLPITNQNFVLQNIELQSYKILGCKFNLVRYWSIGKCQITLWEVCAAKKSWLGGHFFRTQVRRVWGT